MMTSFDSPCLYICRKFHLHNRKTSQDAHPIRLIFQCNAFSHSLFPSFFLCLCRYNSNNNQSVLLHMHKFYSKQWKIRKAIVVTLTIFRGDFQLSWKVVWLEMYVQSGASTFNIKWLLPIFTTLCFWKKKRVMGCLVENRNWNWKRESKRAYCLRAINYTGSTIVVSFSW